MTVEWNPEPQDQTPFWPGATERRSPRWSVILIVIAVVILIMGGIIWWLGRDSDDNAETAVTPDTDSTEQPAENTEPVEESVEEPAIDEPAIDEPAIDDETSADVTEPATDATTATAADTTPTAGPTTTVRATTTTLTTVPPDNADRYGPPTLSARSTVSTVGLDTVTFGMTVAQAQEGAGTVLVPAGPTGRCYHVVPHDAPEGIVFLVHEGTIERVDINSGPITTRSGVGVGSPESMVTDLFGDSIERQVRVDGTVDLVFVPTDPGDRNYRVVFNVSEGEVRSFKSGRQPQVMLDTGCESG